MYLKFDEDASDSLVFFSYLHRSRAKVIEWKQIRLLRLIKLVKYDVLYNF